MRTGSRTKIQWIDLAGEMDLFHLELKCLHGPLSAIASIRESWAWAIVSRSSGPKTIIFQWWKPLLRQREVSQGSQDLEMLHFLLVKLTAPPSFIQVHPCLLPDMLLSQASVFSSVALSNTLLWPTSRLC